MPSWKYTSTVLPRSAARSKLVPRAVESRIGGAISPGPGFPTWKASPPAGPLFAHMSQLPPKTAMAMAPTMATLVVAFEPELLPRRDAFIEFAVMILSQNFAQPAETLSVFHDCG